MATCPTCGQVNPDGARFCSSCGAALAPGPAREVRKTVTVVFADVAGSTALGERLDPESLRRVMARYFQVARGCLERHGGTVEKFIGDAVMAVFGVPTVHEDDALRALRAAAELRDSLGSLNEELERDYGVSLQLRTGVNTGDVVTGTEERLATGDAVNVAARLEQAAEPGEILLGEQTRRLSHGAIEVDRAEPLSLKGKADVVPAYRLLRVIEGAPAFARRTDAPLVGRHDELGEIRAAFDRTISEQRCHLVTLLGPPGIGKSRLAQEVAGMFGDEARVLTGRCLPYGEGITYQPLVEIFRQADAEAELDAALSAGAPEEIFWSVRKALELRAREQPVALVVEDIHWAEATLLDLLEHLVDWARNAPVFLLCLARPELFDARPAWGGQSQAHTVVLHPLAQAESDQLIDHLSGDSALSADARARISGVAAGNPLFLEQVLALLAEGGDLEHVPVTIQALVAARLDSLPDEERDVLERASVAGVEFEWEALRELSPDRGRPTGLQLSALVRKELIRPHELLEDTFRFWHILIRDAVYERISKERRSELHERFARWLDGKDEELDELIGYHLEEAYRCLVALGPPGERALALAREAADRLARSGQRAYARGDAQATVTLLERAADLLPADDRRRLSFLPSLGRALREKGEMERADAVLSEAVEHGRATGEHAIAADAGVALWDLRLHRPAQTGVGRSDVFRELDASIRVFEEVGDEAGLARALTLGGKLRFWGGEAEAGLEDLERAARHALDAGDVAQEAESLQYVLTAMHRGPTPAGVALSRLTQIGARTGINRRLEVALLQTTAELEAMQGRFDEARDVISRAKALTEEHGLPVLLDARIRPAAGAVELLAGDPSAAEQELRLACEGTERLGELGFLSSVAPLLVDALYLQGRDDEARIASDRWRPERLTVPEDADAQIGWRRVRAKLLARAGELDEAERLSREAVAIAAGTDFLDARAQALADLGEVLRAVGRSQESTSALEEAIGLHEAKGNVVAAGRLRRLLAEPPVEA